MKKHFTQRKSRAMQPGFFHLQTSAMLVLASEGSGQKETALR